MANNYIPNNAKMNENMKVENVNLTYVRSKQTGLSLNSRFLFLCLQRIRGKTVPQAKGLVGGGAHDSATVG